METVEINIWWRLSHRRDVWARKLLHFDILKVKPGLTEERTALMLLTRAENKILKKAARKSLIEGRKIKTEKESGKNKGAPGKK